MSKILASLTNALIMSAALSAPFSAYAQQGESASGRSTATGHSMNSDPYQGPNGRYNNEADFERDINGTPCGVNCAHEKQDRDTMNHQ